MVGKKARKRSREKEEPATPATPDHDVVRNALSHGNWRPFEMLQADTGLGRTALLSCIMEMKDVSHAAAVRNKEKGLLLLRLEQVEPDDPPSIDFDD